MIGILSDRLSTDFLEKLGNYTLINEFYHNKALDVDGLFIDWVPKVSDNEVSWMKQASLLQTHIKSGMPIVIFDRGMSLTEKEVKWCKKFNVHLLEPYLNSGREDFKYLPEWFDYSNIMIDDENRNYDVEYYHNRLDWQVKGFEKWILQYAKIFHEKNVAYNSMNISEFKKEEYLNSGLIFKEIDYNIYSEGNVTVVLDTDKAYKTGYLNPMYFYVMNFGCMPLLPVEHKYFHAMFKGLVINDIKDMDYFVSSMSKVKNVVIEEIFDRIKSEWNEFTMEYALDVIRDYYE